MYTRENWEEFIKAMNHGDLCEIDAGIYYYFLEVLPPVWMGRTVNVQGIMRHCGFGFVEGWDYVDAFWTEGDKFFCQKTTQFVRG